MLRPEILWFNSSVILDKLTFTELVEVVKKLKVVLPSSSRFLCVSTGSTNDVISGQNDRLKANRGNERYIYVFFSFK